MPTPAVLSAPAMPISRVQEETAARPVVDVFRDLVGVYEALRGGDVSVARRRLVHAKR